MTSAARIAFLVVVALAVAVGVCVRFYNLGSSPLAIDEYYLAQSIANILKSGIPQFECGGLYTRGIIQQYLTAGLALTGIDMHVALRLLTVISNLLTLPALYLLGKRIGGTNVAMIACILFAVSVWEIEMARFGRMYAPFQAIFIWYCVALIDAYKGSHRGFLTAVALATVAVFIYEGAALLICTTFIPLLAGNNYRTWSWPLAGSSLLFGVWYLTTNFAPSSAIPKLPDQFYQRLDSSLASPAEGWTEHLNISGFGIFELLILAAAGSLSLWYLHSRLNSSSNPASEKTDWIAHTWIGLAILLGAAGFFGIILTLSLALFLWRWLRFDHLNSRSAKVACMWIAFSLFAWTVYFSANLDGPVSLRFSDTVHALFLYPDLYSEVGYRWIRSLPVETLVALFSVPCFLFLMRRSDQQSDNIRLFRLLAGLIVVLAFAVAILPKIYSTIRYTYFLHPLVIVLIASCIVALVNKVFSNQGKRDLAAIAATFIFMTLSVDYSIRHLIEIDSPSTMFRTEMSKWDTDRVYRRWDYRSPAEFVNEHADSGDTVLTTSHSVPYYLTDITYFYTDETDKEFGTIASCRSTIERWSSATLLSNPREFEDATKAVDTNDVWVILRAAERPEATELERRFIAQNKEKIVYSSIDDRLVVVHIASGATE